VDAIIALFSDDAWLTLPPAPLGYRGRDSPDRRFLTAIAVHPPGRRFLTAIAVHPAPIPHRKPHPTRISQAPRPRARPIWIHTAWMPRSCSSSDMAGTSTPYDRGRTRRRPYITGHKSHVSVYGPQD